MQDGIALKNGTKLREYTIQEELGAGSFGITYLAVDKDLNQYAIKEYFPNEIAIRQSNSTVNPKSTGDKEIFGEVLESFIEEAKTLLKFDHPNIVKTNGFFEAKGTVYIVMDYEEGNDLQDLLAKKHTLDEEEILSIILPLLDGLRAVHEQSYLHRDIKPANIYIRTNGIPMLIDFGASRIVLGEKSKSLSAILTDGYAPKEQYSRTSKQGIYTDLYAIGAVMYKMITGKTPIESSARSDAVTDDEPDPHPKLQDAKNLSAYSDNLKKAVDWCLELKGKDRPQSARELQDLLLPEVKEHINPIANDDKYKLGGKYFINGESFRLTQKGFQRLGSKEATYSYELGVKLIENTTKIGKEKNTIKPKKEKPKRTLLGSFFFNISIILLGIIASSISSLILISFNINDIVYHIVSFFVGAFFMGIILGIKDDDIDDWAYSLYFILFVLSSMAIHGFFH